MIRALFTNYNAKLLKDHHPDGFEDEWHDAGTIVQATILPDGKIYLGFGKPLGSSLSGCFNTDAKVGIDFEYVN